MKMSLEQMKQAVGNNDRVCFLSAIMFTEILELFQSVDIYTQVDDCNRRATGEVEKKRNEFQNIVMEEAFKTLSKNKVERVDKIETEPISMQRVWVSWKYLKDILVKIAGDEKNDYYYGWGDRDLEMLAKDLFKHLQEK